MAWPKGRPRDAATIEKLRAANLGRRASPGAIEKMKNHPPSRWQKAVKSMQTPAAKESWRKTRYANLQARGWIPLSERPKKKRGRKFGFKESELTRHRQSKAAVRRWATTEARREQSFKLARRWMDVSYRQRVARGRKLNSEYLASDGSIHHMMSSWEVEFARALDAAGLKWFYQPTHLLLSNGRIYIPDFFVVEWNQYVEIKGIPEWQADKVELAIADGHPIRFVLGEDAFKSILREIKAHA